MGVLCVVAASCAAFLRRPVRILGGEAAGRHRLGFATCSFSQAGDRRLASPSGTSAGVGMLHATRGATSPEDNRCFGLSSGLFLFVRLVFGRYGGVFLISLPLVPLVLVRFCLCLVSVYEIRLFPWCLNVTLLQGRYCFHTVSFGCATQIFPAAAAKSLRSPCLRTLLFVAVLSGFVALLRAFASFGFRHLHTGVSKRNWLLVGGTLRGMGTFWTLNDTVVLAGPDPVSQLPVYLDWFRSFRLNTKNKLLAFFKGGKQKNNNKQKPTSSFFLGRSSYKHWGFSNKAL